MDVEEIKLNGLIKTETYRMTEHYVSCGLNKSLLLASTFILFNVPAKIVD